MEFSLRVPLLNIRLRFSFWFFAVAGLLLLLDRKVLLLYIVVPITIHEAGHLFAMLLCGRRVAELCFTPVSIRIVATHRGSLSYGREFLIAAGGILLNLAAALWLHLFAFASMRNMLMAASNLAVVCINLLPIASLDGGQMVHLVCQRIAGPDLAQSISRATSVLILVPLTAATLILTLRGTVNFTAPALCFYLIVVILLRE